jgi:nicotinamidase-related amidase
MRHSVLDALKTGYSVVVIDDLIRGVAPDTSAQAIIAMKNAGATFLHTVQTLKP